MVSIPGESPGFYRETVIHGLSTVLYCLQAYIYSPPPQDFRLVLFSTLFELLVFPRLVQYETGGLHI